MNIKPKHKPLYDICVFLSLSIINFAYGAGIVRHSRMSTDENLISQKSVPRFIRDCYEECHAPPPLHLLDKYVIMPMLKLKFLMPDHMFLLMSGKLNFLGLILVELEHV